MASHQFDLTRIGAGLVVAEARSALEEATRTGAAIITAPPGTGKTTFIPPLIANLLSAPGGNGGTVLLSQPRRVAVRAAARRIASLDGGSVGDAVGFTVRGERRVSDDTAIEVLTPGVLLRKLLADPELTGVGAVILDEVHERSLDGDLLFALVAEARALRDDLIVVAMSATLDAAQFAELLGSAPTVEVPSVLHPLTHSYAPYAAGRLDDRGVTRGYLEHLAQVAVTEQRTLGCDALVFVPGAREVDDTVRLITERLATGRGSAAVDVLPLHGRLASADQDRAVRGRAAGDPPRIVVSTSLAESSLTVPGVHLVVDSGLSREVRRDRARGMSGLVTVSASRASAEQRAGRAARLGPGHAVRVYSEANFARMPAAAAPEIASADLLDAALLLAVWGTPGGRGLALPTAPPAASMSEAESLLLALSLVSADGRPTPLGTRVAQLPVGVREARALLSGTQHFGDARGVAEVVAAISDDHREPSADLGRLLTELRSGRAPGAQRWKREVQRLERIAREDATSTRPSSGIPDAGEVLALSRPEWIARRTGDHARTYLLASGTRAALPEGSGLIAAEWIAVREVQRAEGRVADGTGAVIRMAGALTAEAALEIGTGLLTRGRSARIVDGKVQVREERKLGAITLSAQPVAARADDTAAAFVAHIRESGLGVLGWSEDALQLRGRLALLHRELGAPWPAVDDAALLTGLEDWLGPDLASAHPSAALDKISLTAALRRLLPWPAAARFDELAPERLAVPSGSHVRIEYALPEASNHSPVVAVKLQELFGYAETPRLVEGRVPILFHLLSPARRPLAVTDDLASFWNGPYQDVRKEMRGKYPRHPWPEDPWTAVATARTKRAQARLDG
ncbi:ATP-dependent helicase HrpB [Leucobacter sp. cx-328]|uniref:ATP-dependent helicase HrpB n=1 Tax=unclassified Leucobacter TaxID=2621730 RepID=UPI00165E1240|nr:ATP-dependent helicase HrpB [Leucobacter sp. cx-328]